MSRKGCAGNGAASRVWKGDRRKILPLSVDRRLLSIPVTREGLAGGEKQVDLILEGVIEAVRLISGFDPDFWQIVALTLQVSLLAVLLATIAGVPAAYVLAVKKFPGREAVVTVFNTCMALPTVAVGLLVYMFLSRQGPLGFLGMLYTPGAIIAGEFILAFPFVTALSVAAFRSADSRVLPTALTLGAGPFQSAIALVSEVRYALLAAVAAGFGRVVTEVGSAVMVGGNIAHSTRTMSTAIALESSRGEFGLGLGLGIILILIAFTINSAVRFLQLPGRA